MLENIPYFSYFISAAVGIGLAAASGFRVFLPLFAVSLASYFNFIPISDTFQWISGLPSLLTLGIATLVEIFAYYIPIIDNFLDTLSVPMASLAGTLLFASQFIEINSFLMWALALIAGGGTAATISSVFSGARAISTTTTGGFGNSVVATTENAAAGLMSIISIVFPILAIIIVFFILGIIIFYGKKLFKKINDKFIKNFNDESIT